MKKYLFILIALFLFGLTTQVRAAVAPVLLINDSLKACQVYGPNARENIINGWRDSGAKFEDIYNAPEKYCNSLGYTLSQDGKVAEVKPIFKTINAIFWIIFICFIFLYYFLFIYKKKRYIVFLLCLLATVFFLVVIVQPFIIYQISPCASGWAMC